MKQTIEVEGLPEGWKVTKLKIPESCVEKIGTNVISSHNIRGSFFDIEKIQPRRIMLEETGEERSISYGDWYEDDEGNVHKYLNKSFGSRRTYMVWREVKETGIPLHNDEPKLSLSIEECKELCVPLSPGGQLIRDKIIKFIKDK